MYRMVVAHEGYPTLSVNQECGRDQEAQATCDGPKPPHFCGKRRLIIARVNVTALHVGSIEHSLNANDPVRRELVIATYLAAAHYTASRMTTVINDPAVRHNGEPLLNHVSGSDVTKTLVRPGPTDVSADVAPCPSEYGGG